MRIRLFLSAVLAVLLLTATAPALEPPTFSNEVVRILQMHMHLLGREVKVTATYPDGTMRPLIHIDDWDFSWQSTYTFAQPIPLPAGTRIDIATFDNSADNLRQPSHPPRPVGWGEGTTDEMAIVFLGVTVDSERIGWRPR